MRPHLAHMLEPAIRALLADGRRPDAGEHEIRAVTGRGR